MRMKLRTLEQRDVPFMLEWIKDPEINRFFRFDADAVTPESQRAFVREAQREDGKNIHLACAGDNDEYLGTVSLKEIDTANGTAEYAVAFRGVAQGTGAAAFATREVLRIAFGRLGLRRVCLNVLAENTRAARFYEKMGFVREGEFRAHILLRGKRQSLVWYGILKEEYEQLYGKID